LAQILSQTQLKQNLNTTHIKVKHKLIIAQTPFSDSREDEFGSQKMFNKKQRDRAILCLTLLVTMFAPVGLVTARSNPSILNPKNCTNQSFKANEKKVNTESKQDCGECTTTYGFPGYKIDGLCVRC